MLLLYEKSWKKLNWYSDSILFIFAFLYRKDIELLQKKLNFWLLNGAPETPSVIYHSTQLDEKKVERLPLGDERKVEVE